VVRGGLGGRLRVRRYGGGTVTDVAVGALARTIVPAAFLAGVGGAVIGLVTGAGPLSTVTWTT
jgi:hypothetical protein